MKKKYQQDAQEITTDVDTQQPQTDKNSKKNTSLLKRLSLLLNIVIFCVYIALDVSKIAKNGWTAVNIAVTVFLGLQIILFALFSILGAKDKAQSKRQKATLKYVKKTKKITIKLLTVITSIVMLIGVKSVSFSDILTIVVAVISLLMMIFSLIRTIQKQARKSRKAKAKELRRQAKQNNDKNS